MSDIANLKSLNTIQLARFYLEAKIYVINSGNQARKNEIEDVKKYIHRKMNSGEEFRVKDLQNFLQNKINSYETALHNLDKRENRQ